MLMMTQKNKDVLEKLTVVQLVKKHRHGTQSFRVDNSPPAVRIMSRMNPIYKVQHCLPKIILTLRSHLCLGLPSGLFPSGFPTKILYAF
jgi:hypothetical protein